MNGGLGSQQEAILFAFPIQYKTWFISRVCFPGMGAAGNRYAAMRLSAKHTTAGYVNELMGGYSYLVFIQSLVDRVDNDWGSVLKDLEELREIVMNRRGAIINMTGDEDTLSVSRPHIEGLLESLPVVDTPSAVWSSVLPGGNEALTLPTQVRFSGTLKIYYGLSSTSVFHYNRYLSTNISVF